VCVSTNGNNPPFSFKTIVPFSSLPLLYPPFLSTSPLKYPIAQSIYKHGFLIKEESEFHLRRRWCIFPISKHYYIIGLSQVAKNILQVELMGPSLCKFLLNV
jgi:hypothetical protein